MSFDPWTVREPEGEAAGPLIDACALVEAIDVECRLLGELCAVLRRQREDVADDDVQGVDESVVAAHRVMHTLGEAKRRRRTLVGFFAPAEDTPLDELDTALGPNMTTELADARTRLHAAARDVARHIETNRQVLRAALQHSDRFSDALHAITVTGYELSGQDAAALGAVLIDGQPEQGPAQ